MAKIVKKLTDLVGNTPLMELSGYCGKYGMEQNIIAKLEAFNPAGSCLLYTSPSPRDTR